MPPAPIPRAIAIGRLVPDRPGPAAVRPAAPRPLLPAPVVPDSQGQVRRLRPAAGAALLGVLAVTAVGLLVAGLRPARQSVTATWPEPAPSRPTEVAPVVPAEAPAPAAVVRAPDPVPPGESRPRPAGAPQPVAFPNDSPSRAASPAPDPQTEKLGTAIAFVRSPAVAFDLAARDRKLVLVLHLAGHLEDPGFT